MSHDLSHDPTSHGAPLNPLLKHVGTTTNLPREGRPPKLRPGKEGINQRGNKETKDNPEGAVKRRLEYLSIGPLEAVHSTELGFMEEWPEKKANMFGVFQKACGRLPQT